MIRLQEGEAAAFEELVARYRGPLRGYFINRLRDQALADDLVQETLLKVHTGFWDYIPLGRFRGWLFRIAHNLTVDTVRRQARDVVLSAYRGREDDDGPDRMARLADAIDTPAAATILGERADLIDDLIGALPEDQRETVILHYFQGVPLPEVAIAMETNLSTCKSRLRLAREKLKGRIESLGLVAP